MQIEQQRVLATKVVLEYKSVLIEGLQHSFPGLSILALGLFILFNIE